MSLGEQPLHEEDPEGGRGLQHPGRGGGLPGETPFGLHQVNTEKIVIDLFAILTPYLYVMNDISICQTESKTQFIRLSIFNWRRDFDVK